MIQEELKEGGLKTPLISLNRKTQTEIDAYTFGTTDRVTVYNLTENREEKWNGTTWVTGASLLLNDYLSLTGGTLSGSLTGVTFTLSGGTSDGVLLADGSSTSLTGITATYLPSTTVGEPTGFTPITNIGTISQANYDIAFSASTTVSGTTYLIVG